MKIGVISDIHANLPALEAVLDELSDREVDAIVCVGDIIGVLGHPNEVVSLIKQSADHAVFGNHDTRVFPDRDWLPVSDYEVVEYEQALDEVTDENYEWLTSLPGMVEAYENVVIAHARPDEDAPEGGLEYDDAGVRPSEFVSITTEAFDADGDGGVLLLGHTHKQHAVNVGKFKGQPDALVLNPGSVGFPFEYDVPYGEDDAPTLGKASFAVVDTETLEYDLCSVEYDATPVFDHLRDHDLLDDSSAGKGSMQTRNSP